MIKPLENPHDAKEQARFDHELLETPFRWMKTALVYFVKVKVLLFIITWGGIGFIFLTNWRPAGGYWNDIYYYERVSAFAEGTTITYVDAELRKLVLSENDIPFPPTVTDDRIGFWTLEDNGEYAYTWIRSDQIMIIGNLPLPGDRIQLVKDLETRTISLINQGGHEQFAQSYEEWVLTYFERKNLDFTKLFPNN